MIDVTIPSILCTSSDRINGKVSMNAITQVVWAGFGKASGYYGEIHPNNHIWLAILGHCKSGFSGKVLD